MENTITTKAMRNYLEVLTTSEADHQLIACLSPASLRKLVDKCQEQETMFRKPDFALAFARVQADDCKAPAENPHTFAITSMRKALVKAHEAGNRHAITKDEAICADSTEERWKQWLLWVADLKDLVDNYVTCQMSGINEDQKVQAKEAIYPMWKQIIAVGGLDWVDRTDLDNLFKYDAVDLHINGKGAVRTTARSNKFRQGIETYIGIRMANNMVMSGINRDIIMAYQSARKSIDTLSVKIDGDGKKNFGLVGEIETLNLKIATERKYLTSLGVQKEAIDKILESLIVQLTKSKKDLESAKKNLAKNKKIEETQREKYNAIMASVKPLSFE